MSGQGENARTPAGQPQDNTGSEFRASRRHLKYTTTSAAEESTANAVSPEEFLLSVASSEASQPLSNLDSSVWGVLTAISTVARRRPQGANMILNSNEHAIGRLVDDPHFRIDSSSVSGKHCKIYWKRVYQNDREYRISFFLKDHSTNGTYLNWKKLTKSSPEAEVSHGDIISFDNAPHYESSYTFVFREASKANSLNEGTSEKSKADTNQHLLRLLNVSPPTKDPQHSGNQSPQPSFAVDPAVMEIGPPIMFPHQLYQPQHHQVSDSVQSPWINTKNIPYSQQTPPVSDLYRLGFPTLKFGSIGDRHVESSVLRNPNIPDHARNPRPMHPPPGFSIIPQVNRDVQPSISDLHVSSSTVESSLSKLTLLDGGRVNSGEENSEVDEESESAVDLFPNDEKDSRRKQFSSNKEARSDKRGQRMLPQRMRFVKCRIPCRANIAIFDAQFLSIYESLIPPKSEQDSQIHLLNKLQNLVKLEWPEARVHLYGSCANSFGVSNSDVDVCLALNDVETPEVLMKLEMLLKSHNYLDVQALPRARVPIVKLRDPETGIPCDICVNNMLAVVNTKLLGDYSKIDVRLRQLVLIVKHWAKSRDVNETYKGTLSSYAYVLMCIHFLQLRGPPVLPCLQELEATFRVTVEGTQCAYMDRVERLKGFGMRNRETISRLVWGFFNYWAYCHDYTNDVVSVRSGCLIGKREKEWNRRVGFDRHLICIEDPFLLSHDLGRVVDKGSIRVLREEFERAAEILQFHSNPCVALFDPYVP